MAIDFHTWITFAIASEFILLIPGPTILLVVAYSLSHGKTATFPLVTQVGFARFHRDGLFVHGPGTIAESGF